MIYAFDRCAPFDRFYVLDTRFSQAFVIRYFIPTRSARDHRILVYTAAATGHVPTCEGCTEPRAAS